MKIETAMTVSAVEALREIGLKFNSLDHDPKRKAANAIAIQFCDSIHINWSGISFNYLDNRDEAHNVHIDQDLLNGKTSFEEYWAKQKEFDEYDYEYDYYLEAKETYERLKDKYENE